MSKSLKHIKQFIAEGQELKAINLMVELSEDICLSLHNDSVLLSYQYNKVLKDVTLGLELRNSSKVNNIIHGAIVVTDDLIKKSPVVYVTIQ